MSKIKHKLSAFTLIEMLIVLVLIGVIYTLILNRYKPKKEELYLQSKTPFRSMLLPLWNHSHVILLCGDKCKKCNIYDDGGKIIKKLKRSLFKQNDIPKFYTFNDNGEINRKEFLHIQAKNSEEKICFRFDMYPNKSSSELLLKYKNGKVIYLPPYFNNTLSFSSLEKAQNYFENLKTEIAR